MTSSSPIPIAPASSWPLLHLKDCSVRWPGRPALSEVSMTVSEGERVALVGANGAGKTTLLRLLHGSVLQSEGRREELVLRSGVRPSQAMLFQKPFVLSLSAAMNVRLALWLRGVARSERRTRALEALARVGLREQASQRATTLSGGQQQRLALARAWALQPQILLLDEPTASLDPSAKREVESLIDAFAADGMTLVFSSHNLGQVKRLAQRVVYLESGRVGFDGPVDAFFGGPLPAGAEAFVRGELPVPWR